MGSEIGRHTESTPNRVKNIYYRAKLDSLYFVAHLMAAKIVHNVRVATAVKLVEPNLGHERVLRFFFYYLSVILLKPLIPIFGMELKVKKLSNAFQPRENERIERDTGKYLTFT